MLIAFHKPYGVISQFTGDGSSNRTLGGFGFPKNVYPIGRLDADSEGLLLLSDEPGWSERLLNPRHAHEREYWVQVEKIPTPEALKKLERGVSIAVGGRAVAAARGGAAAPPPPMSKDYRTLPCRAWMLEPQPKISTSTQIRWGESLSSPDLKNILGSTEFHPTKAEIKIPPRVPPIRFRKTVPTCWIGLELVEGKNRQVRRMTAAIGHPTLRLIRMRIGNFWLGDLPQGRWKILSPDKRKLL